MSIFPPRVGTALSEVLDSFVLVLWYAGIQITLLIAGCQSIPGTIYEAASIDGANGWETLWKITLPGILPFILVSMIYTLVDLSSLIDNPVLLMITEAIDDPVIQGMGYASAIGWIYQLVIMLMIGLIFLLFRKSATRV
jgi:ABC-type sugar transport system permease subunit